MKAVHFGAGNIGRGFIGEVLAKNDFSITFVDINDTIIEALKQRQSYTIELADESKAQRTIGQVTGLNNATQAEAVVEAIAQADLVTTAIGPNILPRIASLIAQGIEKRQQEKNFTPLDVIACENMLGGSTFLGAEVKKQLSNFTYCEQYVGFPDAAVDRIVPEQEHTDPLFVQVEPFSEWVVQENACKSTLRLTGVDYVVNLEPYIERKLFSVNTGHATVAYTGALQGYDTIDEAMQDYLVVAQLRSVLQETGRLLVAKWGFDEKEHQIYLNKIIQRFQNKYISDAIRRVARTPLRKLGAQERFVRPMSELKKFNQTPFHLVETIGMIFNYYDPTDEQSRQLHEMLGQKGTEKTIATITGISDKQLLQQIKQAVEKYAYKAA